MNKRPIVIITISYILGILWGLYLSINIVPFIFIILVMNYVLYNIFNNNSKIIIIKYIKCIIKNLNYTNFKYSYDFKTFKLINIGLCVIAISSIIVQYKEYRYINIYKDVQNIKFVGIVVSEKSESEYYYNYVVKLKKTDNSKNLKNTKLLVKVKKNNNCIYKKLKYGDMIVGNGTFEKASVRRNYKGFDYFNYLKTKNIYGICKVEYSNITVKKENSLLWLDMYIYNIKNKLIDNLTELIPNNDIRSTVIAFLMGDSSFISDEQKEMYSNANLSHILAISGMHVTYVIAGVGWLLQKSDKRKSRYIYILLLLLFCKFTGSSVSVIRAVIMYIIFIISKVFYRKSDTLNNVAVSCLRILFINPYNILDLGFQLSFAGTLGIILFNKKVNKFFENLLILKTSFFNYSNVFDNNEKVNNMLKYNEKVVLIIKKIYSILSVSISANILIFPILMYNFNTISFVFIISNILITPILGIMSLFGYVTIFSSLISMKIANIISIIIKILINIFIILANLSSKLSIMRFVCVTPNVINIIIIYVVIVYIFKFYNKNHNYFIIKIVSIFMVILIFFNLIIKFNSGLKIHFIDVGQGDCSLIITNTNKTILIDGGGSETGNYDVGKNVLLPYLLDRKIKHIDYMFFSHLDSDHALGLFTVIENMKVNNIVISVQGKETENYKYLLELVSKKKINLIYVYSGNKLNIGDVKVTILHPQKQLIINNTINNNSIVCKLEYKSFSMLFTGDIENEAEELIQSKNVNLNADILKVAHHGSKTSSSQEFLNLVKPKIALIGVGEKNKFGHPNAEILERFKYIGTKIYRTDKNGEITVIVNKNGKIVKVEKCVN